jgi:hypothetical protein
MREIPIDLELKKTRAANRSTQSVAQENFAKRNGRLLVKIYGNEPNPEIVVNQAKAFTKKQLADLRSMTSRIQQKISAFSQGAGSGRKPSAGDEGSRPVETTDWKLTKQNAMTGMTLILLAYNFSQAHSPEQVIDMAASTAEVYTGAELGGYAGSFFGPEGMAVGEAVGSMVSSIYKDPRGFVEGTMDCLSGGECGEIPYEITRPIFPLQQWIRH